MGLLDRYVTKVTGPPPGPPPDPTSLVELLLDPDDRLLAWVKVTPIGAAADGAPGSIGRTLPRDPVDLYLVVSRIGLSAWTWSGLPSEPPATFYRIAAENVVSVDDTDRAAQGGDCHVRVGFIDDSSFEFRVSSDMGAFRAACARRWGGAWRG